jgi:hypothetical protein
MPNSPGKLNIPKKRDFKDMTEGFAAVGFAVEPRKGRKRPATVFLTNEDYGLQLMPSRSPRYRVYRLSPSSPKSQSFRSRGHLSQVPEE